MKTILTIVVLITAVSFVGFIYIKKPMIRTGLGVIAAFGLMMTVLIGSFTYMTKYRIHLIDSSISQDEKYELLFLQIGEPDWPFGSTHARLVLKDKFGTIAKYSFDVRNDGGSVQPDLWRVTWRKNSVEAVISGEEQNDEQFILSFDGVVDFHQLNTKYGRMIVEQQKENSQKFEKIWQEQTDEDGYPLTEEYQAYKRELLKIANEINHNTADEIEFHLSAKGNPYAVILSETKSVSREKNELHLIFNKAYDDLKNEYVLEEYHYGTNGEQFSSPVILDFYLIDCQSLEVTDEKIDTWH